jgi:hypothetical protein
VQSTRSTKIPLQRKTLPTIVLAPHLRSIAVLISVIGLGLTTAGLNRARRAALRQRRRVIRSDAATRLAHDYGVYYLLRKLPIINTSGYRLRGSINRDRDGGCARNEH